MAQSGGNSIILWTYFSVPDIFLGTGTDNMFEFAEKMQNQQNNKTVRTSITYL